MLRNNFIKVKLHDKRCDALLTSSSRQKVYYSKFPLV